MGCYYVSVMSMYTLLQYCTLEDVIQHVTYATYDGPNDGRRSILDQNLVLFKGSVHNKETMNYLYVVYMLQTLMTTN